MFRIFQKCDGVLVWSCLRGHKDYRTAECVGDSKAFMDYVDSVAKYLDRHTPPDEYLMYAVEEDAGIPEQMADDWRRTLIAGLGQIHTKTMKEFAGKIFKFNSDGEFVNECHKQFIKSVIDTSGYQVPDKPFPLASVEMANGVLTGQVKVYHGLIDSLKECGMDILAEHFAKTEEHSKDCWAAYLISGWDGTKVNDETCDKMYELIESTVSGVKRQLKAIAQTRSMLDGVEYNPGD